MSRSFVLLFEDKSKDKERLVAFLSKENTTVVGGSDNTSTSINT
jgi:hypothetical protein